MYLEVTRTLTYDDGGRRTRVTRPGGYIEYAYNARDWITAVQNRAGGVTRYDATYYYNDGTLWDHTGNPLKRVENFGGSDFTTTLRYDNVYRETEETKRDSGGATVYTLVYTYDEAGNRITRYDGTSTIAYICDANNKLRGIKPYGQPGPPPNTFGYDGAGNMTSVAGPMYGTKTLTYDDESRLASVAYGAVTDSYVYNWQGLRTRAYLNGTWYRYLYKGERVLQELTNAGGVNATYTTENDSYYGTLLHIQRATGESRFPLYDEIGSARGLGTPLALSPTPTRWTRSASRSRLPARRPTHTSSVRRGATSPTPRASSNSARGSTGLKWGGL